MKFSRYPLWGVFRAVNAVDHLLELLPLISDFVQGGRGCAIVRHSK